MSNAHVLLRDDGLPYDAAKTLQAVRLLRSGECPPAVALRLHVPQETVELVRQRFRIPVVIQ